KKIHLAAVEGHLLGLIAVVLVCRSCLIATQPERVGTARSVGGVEKIWIGGKEISGQAFDRGSAWQRCEFWLALWIERVRIGREVVVERNVLLKDDHDVPDRILRLHSLSATRHVTSEPCGDQCSYRATNQFHCFSAL